jgi:hypothetical protein
VLSFEQFISFKGAPSLGRKSFWPVLYIHLTRTHSCPPDNRNEPSVVKFKQINGNECQWRVVLDGVVVVSVDKHSK